MDSFLKAFLVQLRFGRSVLTPTSHQPHPHLQSLEEEVRVLQDQCDRLDARHQETEELLKASIMHIDLLEKLFRCMGPRGPKGKLQDITAERSRLKTVIADVRSSSHSAPLQLGMTC
jgi:hypothetical protein